MKRRGFLGLFGALPFIPKVVLQETPPLESPKPLEIPPLETFKLGDSRGPPAISFQNDTDSGIYRTYNGYDIIYVGVASVDERGV